MTLVIDDLSARTAGQPRATSPAVPITRPGLTERALVVVTVFVLIHETPNAWIKTRASLAEDPTNPLAVVTGLLLMAIAVARIVGNIDDLIAVIRAERAVFLFAGVAFATMFWSADPVETAEKSIILIAVTFYAAYLVLRFSLHEILRLFAIMFAISAMLNTAFVVAVPSLGTFNGDFTGVFSQKNALGFVAALAVPVLIAAARTGSVRRPFYTAAAAQLFLLAGSQSKTMLLATLVPMGLMAIYHLLRSRRTLRGAVLTALAGSGVFTVLFATANIGLLAEWLDKDVTLTGRVPMWQNLLPIAQERLLVGHGYKATFAGYWSPVHEVWIQNRWNPTHAHNAVLQIVLEMGVIGLIPFVVSYLRGVAGGIKLVALVPGTVGLWPLTFLTTTLLVSITESGMSSSTIGWLMYVVAVTSIALHLQHRQRLGFSNDLQRAVRANRLSDPTQPVAQL